MPTVNVADEIMDILKGVEKDVKSETPEIVEEVLEEPEPEIELEETTWDTDEDGKGKRYVPFSKKYWKPKLVPDHLVPEFTGYDCADVPDPYIPPRKEFEQLSLAFSLGLKVNVVGPTGAGKTLMYEYYAATTGRPLLRIEHNQELDKVMVFGQTHINVDEEGKQSTDFVPGILPNSMSEPTVVILDELTRATSFANMIYQRVLDRRELFLPEMKDSGAAAVTPNEDWIICASDNTKGNGDDMEMYAASNVQDAAFINRWDMVIEQDYLTSAAEDRLMKKLAPKMKLTERKNLVKFSKLVHAGFKKGDICTAFSPRNLSAIARLVNAGVPIKDAINMNYTSRVSKSDHSDVQECLRAAFGS